jgi:hypothetical protein
VYIKRFLNAMIIKYANVTDCNIHNKKKSNCLRIGDVEGSRTGSFCAELNDILSLGRVDVGLGTARDGVDMSGRRIGDFCGDGNFPLCRGCSTAVEPVEDVGVSVPVPVPDSSSCDISTITNYSLLIRLTGLFR